MAALLDGSPPGKFIFVGGASISTPRLLSHTPIPTVGKPLRLVLTSLANGFLKRKRRLSVAVLKKPTSFTRTSWRNGSKLYFKHNQRRKHKQRKSAF